MVGDVIWGKLAAVQPSNKEAKVDANVTRPRSSLGSSAISGV